MLTCKEIYYEVVDEMLGNKILLEEHLKNKKFSNSDMMTSIE